jgi:hypothetical protein
MHAYACVHLNIYMYTVICTKKKGDAFVPLDQMVTEPD